MNFATESSTSKTVSHLAARTRHAAALPSGLAPAPNGIPPHAGVPGRYLVPPCCAPVVRGAFRPRRYDIRTFQAAAGLFLDYIFWPSVALTAFTGWWLLLVLMGPE